MRKHMRTIPVNPTLGRAPGIAWLCRREMPWLRILLAILIAYEPLAAQQTKTPPQPVQLSIAAPVFVSTSTQVVPNVQTTEIISPGSVDLSNPPIKIVPQVSTVTLPLQGGGTNGNCATPIPPSHIIQDCTLGNTAFESNIVSLYLATHGRPQSDASTIYTYGGVELRDEIRSFMFDYIKGVIQGDPSTRSHSDQAVVDWLTAAVQKNDVDYYTALTNAYNSWNTSPCTYQIDPTVASQFGASYKGEGYCGGSYQEAFTPLPAPDVSYFEEVGQLYGYDSKLSGYDPSFCTSSKHPAGCVPNAVLQGAQILQDSEQFNSHWESLAGALASTAVSLGTAALVVNFYANIAPFASRQYLDPNEVNPKQVRFQEEAEQELEQNAEQESDAAAEEAEADVEVEEAEGGLEIAEGAGTAAGAASIVLIFVFIGVQASIDFYQTLQNTNAINADIATGKTVATTPPDLKAKLVDSKGYEQVFETFIQATLPDAIQTQTTSTQSASLIALRSQRESAQAQGGRLQSDSIQALGDGTAGPLPPIPSSTPANDVVYIINHTLNEQTSVSTSFNYTTWDPLYANYNFGNPPFAQYGTSVNAYPYDFGFIQTIEQGPVSHTWFSPTIKYIDPNNGLRYIAQVIDHGRFLVTKAPPDVKPSDFDCPVDAVIGLTQSPGTQIPSQCKSFIMNTLNIWSFDTYNTTVQLPQPPVFATPNAADLSIAAENDFTPQLDITTQGLPCSIRTTGTLPPGYAFQNGALFLHIPSQAVPGTYQFNFVADCETLGLGTPFLNYSFGNSITTQSFTANVYAGATPGSGNSLSGSSRVSSRGSTIDAVSSVPAAAATPALQFIFPTSSTSLKFTQGRSTTMTLVTNGGPGTTITAGANALPPGMTLSDNGDGTAVVSGIPRIPAQPCSSNCAITASAPGFTSASLILSDTVAPPVLPTIPATISASWKAGEYNTATIDGAEGSNGKVTNVPLTWSVVGTPPDWVNFRDYGNNMATINGFPPASAAGQTIPIKFQYTYGGKPGFASPIFTVNLAVTPAEPVLRVSPTLLFEVGVQGSGTINSSTFSGDAGLGGSWNVMAPLPTGLTATPTATSLTISGAPENPGVSWIPIQFTTNTGTTVTRRVPLMITQPASLAGFPSRLVLFTGVPANFILPVTAGFPRTAAGSPGDGLPSTTGTNLTLTGSYSTTNGFQILSDAAALLVGGTPLAPSVYPLTVSAQTVLSTGPVGDKVSQSFTVYVQPAGDVNLDGKVNCDDYNLIKAHFGAGIGAPNYLDLADPNRDGVVNIRDLAFVQSHLPSGTVCH